MACGQGLVSLALIGFLFGIYKVPVWPSCHLCLPVIEKKRIHFFGKGHNNDGYHLLNKYQTHTHRDTTCTIICTPQK